MRFVICEHGLAPFDQEARDFLDDLATAEPIEMEALNPRDMAFHRHIFGVIDALAEAMHTTPELVRAELLFSTGNFQLLGQLFGTTVIAVDSMSRAAMKDHALHHFWDEAKEVIRRSLFARVKDASERIHLEELLALEPA